MLFKVYQWHADICKICCCWPRPTITCIAPRIFPKDRYGYVRSWPFDKKYFDYGNLSLHFASSWYIGRKPWFLDYLFHTFTSYPLKHRLLEQKNTSKWVQLLHLTESLIGWLGLCGSQKEQGIFCYIQLILLLEKVVQTSESFHLYFKQTKKT